MANLGINIGTLVGALGQPNLYPLINGFRPSWASIEFRLAIAGAAPGSPVVAIQSIDYKGTRERKKTRGTNVNPLGKTRGQLDYTCKIKYLLAEWNQMIAQLGQQDSTGQNSFGDTYFNLQVQYAEANSNIITDTIIGCTIDSAEQSSSDGVDDIVRESELSPLLILFNGQPMSNQPLGAPQP